MVTIKVHHIPKLNPQFPQPNSIANISKTPIRNASLQWQQSSHLSNVSHQSSDSPRSHAQSPPNSTQNPPAEPNPKPQNPSDLGPLMRALKWVRHGFDAGSCFGMILKMGLGRNVEGIEGLCDEIRYGCDEEGFEGLFDVLVRNGRVREAKRVMDAMDSSRWDRHCGDLDRFNAVLGAVVAGKGGLRDVVFVYKEMVKSGLVPNVETLNRLIEALFDAGKVDAALDQCGRMRKKGCVPNRRTLEIVTDRLVDHDRVDDSIGLMNEILRRPG